MPSTKMSLSTIDSFQKLLDVCEPHLTTEEQLLEFMKKRYRGAKEEYTQSEECLALIERTTQHIVDDPSNIYVHIKEIISELKAYKKNKSNKRKLGEFQTDSENDEKKSKVLKSAGDENADSAKNSPLGVNGAGESTGERLEKEDSVEKERTPEKEKETLKKNSEPVPGTSSSVSEERPSSPAEEKSQDGESKSMPKKKASQRQIEKLEKLLGKISKEIKKLAERELSLEDMEEDDSIFMQEERYKARFVKVWEKLCEVKGREPQTGRLIEQKFRFQGTRYSEVNKKIERFVNRKQIFPDFHDIVTIIKKVNIKNHLHLGKNKVDQLAREAFTEVGNQLQQRREKDFVSNFGCHITESYRDYHDPALFDRDLKRKLEDNKPVAKEKMEQVISKYSHKQEVGDAESSSEEEEEEEEDRDEIDGNQVIDLELEEIAEVPCDKVKQEDESHRDSPVPVVIDYDTEDDLEGDVSTDHVSESDTDYDNDGDDDDGVILLEDDVADEVAPEVVMHNNGTLLTDIVSTAVVPLRTKYRLGTDSPQSSPSPGGSRNQSPETKRRMVLSSPDKKLILKKFKSVNPKTSKDVRSSPNNGSRNHGVKSSNQRRERGEVPDLLESSSSYRQPSALRKVLLEGEAKQLRIESYCSLLTNQVVQKAAAASTPADSQEVVVLDSDSD